MGLTDRHSALVLLRKAEGNNHVEFRQGQWEAIDAIINRRERTLVVQRTGWGKSTVYFLATRILRDNRYGPTLIISPLLALMRNQIMTAKRYGINAVSINSTNSQNWSQIEEKIFEDKVDVVLISPERLSNNEFVEKVLSQITDNIGLFVVDEAHCISDWGHDFRPNYRKIVNVLRQMPVNVRILGTTATANTRVIEDIKEQLGFVQVRRGPLIRHSLALQNLNLPSQASRMAWLAENIRSIPGSGIIYTLTKRDAENLSTWLQEQGISAYAYYSGVESVDGRNSNQYRSDLEGQLLNNKIKALVATTALSMGFDKPDLGFVIHFQAPGSIISYYQQVGRAGRGIDNAYGILMFGNEDAEIHEHFRNNAFPKDSWVKAIIDSLGKGDGMSTVDLTKEINLKTNQIKRVLDFLSVMVPSPVIYSDSKWYRTPVSFQMDHEKIQWLNNQREVEWSEIQSYGKHQGCLMEFLVKALDDELQTKCGKCGSCIGKPRFQPSENVEFFASATRFLTATEIPLKSKRRIPSDAFPSYGFEGKFSISQQAQAGKILSFWGDAGWGTSVLQGKHEMWYSDKLVEAVVNLYRRWQPQPAPKWITCIPSNSKPRLVAGFAERLSKKLGLPFSPVIIKVKDNQPQKVQENSYHQCSNLDGVFEIKTPISKEAVLLIDDVIDSGWTMTIAAALLRRAGSGPVWPLALATSKGRG